ncbi:MAG: ABC transporter permease [Christensenellaceae bacterium]|nr:ABC transporter permease [Christensenellaceae bacterium]
MKIAQAVKMAMKAIAGNKMRSFLTMLGIIIGVLSVTVLVGIVQGATSQITDQLSNLGTNMISVSMRGRRTQTLELDEIMNLRGQGAIDMTAPAIQSSMVTKAGGNTHTTTVYGTTDGYDLIRGYSIARGRFLSQADVSNLSAVCIVGVDVADELFGQRGVIGESIRIDGRAYQIVGLFEEKGSSMGVSQDDMVCIPITLAQRVFRNTQISTFYATTYTENDIDAAVNQLKAFMFQKTNDSDAYNVYSQTQLLETMNEMIGTMTLLLAGIAGISLLVGGIGIMNIMLVSVTERTREIGIRKAVGAQRLDIMLQFIVEAVAISVAGGLIGLGLGFAVKYAVAPIFNLNMVISAGVSMLALGFSVVIGVVFGSYPASKAAGLLPIEALRYE